MTYFQWNMIIIAVIITSALIGVYFVFKKDAESSEENAWEDEFSITYLEEQLVAKINEIVDEKVELLISEKEKNKREYHKGRLSVSVRTCAQGNVGERDYLKDYGKQLLQDYYGVNENTIFKIIPFHQPQYLSAQDKFEILYVQFNRDKKYRAFEELNKLCNFDREKYNEFGSYYEITAEDIDTAYNKYAQHLSYVECLEVVMQRIYQNKYGNSVADILRYDASIDGISAGCSGASTEQYNYMEEAYSAGGITKAMSYNSLWIFFHGKAIHLSFLSFTSQNDLVRTCKNLYRYGSAGHLNSKIGFKLTYQADGSRVVVVRPNFSTHWAFFLRKFDSTKSLTIDKLLINKNTEIVLEMLKWIVKGCLNAVISGDQNSGKTTCLKALAIFFDRRNPIRTTEQEFELWLNNVYDRMNCICLRSTEATSVLEAIAIQKKMDAAIMLLGEVNNYILAAAYIDLCLSGTKSVLCTCHTVSTEDLVDYFRNAVMATLFNNEMIAEEQVANSISIDIHWEKTPDGRRYISYINEIIPYPRENPEGKEKRALDRIADTVELMARKRAFYVRPLITLENDQYVLHNRFSVKSTARIMKNLASEDRVQFEAYYTDNGGNDG